MDNRILFTYGEFYDVPRMITFEFGGTWYYLDSPFDEDRDDYPDSYDVYRVPFDVRVVESDNPLWWTGLSDSDRIGTISIEDVGLDATRRKSIDGESFSQWLSTAK